MTHLRIRRLACLEAHEEVPHYGRRRLRVGAALLDADARRELLVRVFTRCPLELERGVDASSGGSIGGRGSDGLQIVKIATLAGCVVYATPERRAGIEARPDGKVEASAHGRAVHARARGAGRRPQGHVDAATSGSVELGMNKGGEVHVNLFRRLLKLIFRP